MKMSKRVPKHIADLFPAGAHGFRKRKRRQAKLAEYWIAKLALGCAYYPTTYKDVKLMREAIRRVRKDLTTRNWGK